VSLIYVGAGDAGGATCAAAAGRASGGCGAGGAARRKRGTRQVGCQPARTEDNIYF
jgi:hypothetical protein